MHRTSIRDALKATAVGTELTVAGWVRSVRTSKGGFSFITLNDGSCLASIQVVADEQLPNYHSEVVHLSAGCSVAVTGQLVPSQGKGQAVELRASEVQVIGRADPDKYPIQPKRHSFEFLRKQAHLRPRTNTFGAVARVRNVICAAIHEFFQSRGFLYIHTPIITPSDCEGAGRLFRVTTLEPGQADERRDFFGRRTNLTVSGQLELEAYACALGNVYSFGPTFRAENSNTPRHLAEFWMVEPEMAFCDLAGDAALAEEFLKFIFKAVLERCEEDLAFFNQRIDSTVIETLAGIVESEFVHLTYTEAVEILRRADRKWEYPPAWGADLQTEHERFLTEQTFNRPVIVTDSPAAIKPFYMRVSDSPPPQGPTVAAMDVLVPKVGEIIGGSQREERLEVLTERMRAAGIEPDDYWWYLDLRRYGTVPHAGFGLGVERTVAWICGIRHVREAIPFPRVMDRRIFP